MEYCKNVCALPYAHFLIKEEEALSEISEQSKSIRRTLRVHPAKCVDKKERQDLLIKLNQAEVGISKQQQKKGDLLLALLIAVKIIEFSYVFFTLGALAIDETKPLKEGSMSYFQHAIGLGVFAISQLFTLYNVCFISQYRYKTTKRIKGYKKTLTDLSDAAGGLLGEIDKAVLIHPDRIKLGLEMLTETEELLQKVHRQMREVSQTSSSGSEGDVDEPLPESCESSDTF